MISIAVVTGLVLLSCLQEWLWNSLDSRWAFREGTAGLTVPLWESQAVNPELTQGITLQRATASMLL